MTAITHLPRWTPAEDENLIRWWHAGLPVRRIGAALGRSERGVWARVKKLRALGRIDPLPNAYLPDAGPVVPCAVCGSPFTRVRVVQRLCPERACRLAAARKSRDPHAPPPGMCPRCRVNPKAPRRSGGTRSWCRSCETKQKAQYQATPAGKATLRRYYQSHKGRQAQRQAAARYAARKKAAQT